MTKIIRLLNKATGGITPEEKQRMDEHASAWIANAMRTDTVNPDVLTRAMKDLYRVSGLKEPRVVIVASPRIMAMAGGFAAAIWWLRKNTDATDATRAATYDATSVATYDATYDATDAATRAATDDATRAATDAATRAATSVATYAATDVATRATTDVATRDATSVATYAATDVATRATTDVATRDATDDATDEWHIFIRLAQEMFGKDFMFAINCANNWGQMYQGGNMWSAWNCYLTAYRDILGLRLAEYEKYAAWEQAAKTGGFRIMHDEFCMVSDFPCRLRVDEENRPHCANGPSHQWRDGWSLYYWHGVRVTRQIVEAPQTLTVEQIEAEPNAEVRRIMIDRYGAKRYAEDSGAVVIHELSADHPIKGLRTARLLRKEVPNDVPIVMLDVLNSTPEPDGTTKRYQLRIDPDAYSGMAGHDCWAAAASTWRTRNPDGTLGKLAFADYRDYVPEFES